MSSSNILWALIYICVISLVFFIGKEIWRNKDGEWKEIFKKDSKKNLNDLLGITKTTFLALVTSLILVSVGLLALAETANKGHKIEGRKHQNDYRSFILKSKD